MQVQKKKNRFNLYESIIGKGGHKVSYKEEEELYIYTKFLCGWLAPLYKSLNEGSVESSVLGIRLLNIRTKANRRN